MRNIGIILNAKKQEAIEVANWLLQRLFKQGINVVLPEECATALKRSDLAINIEQMRSTIDMAISLGGDGTLLGTSRRLAGTEVPILGINLGQLGFLTDVELEVLSQEIEKVLAGKYTLENRTMLVAKVIRHGQEVGSHIALNDVVIAKGAIARLIRLRTYVDDKFVTMYPADGLIVSTATGSTGYSLSAGGPILHPTLPVIVITPICPHTLSARSLVIADHQQVKVIVQANHTEMLLTADGQCGVELVSNDMIIIEKAPYVTRLVKVSGRDFFEILRTKMERGNTDGRPS